MERDTSCVPCWWQEGGRCYCNDLAIERDKNGRSIMKAQGKCRFFCSKRAVYEKCIPSDMLVIVSEGRINRK